MPSSLTYADVCVQCMAMGIKNLQTQHRSSQRRDRNNETNATSPAIPIPHLNTSYANVSSSMGHPSSHSHSTSLSSVHSNSHIPTSISMNNHYTTGPSSFSSTSGMLPYDDSGLGGEVNDIDDQDYEHDHNDGSNSDGSRSANSAYDHHHTRNSLSINGYGGQGHTSSNNNIPRSWNEQQMMGGGMGNNRLPSLQDDMGLGRILDQRSAR